MTPHREQHGCFRPSNGDPAPEYYILLTLFFKQTNERARKHPACGDRVQTHSADDTEIQLVIILREAELGFSGLPSSAALVRRYNKVKKTSLRANMLHNAWTHTVLNKEQTRRNWSPHKRVRPEISGAVDSPRTDLKPRVSASVSPFLTDILGFLLTASRLLQLCFHWRQPADTGTSWQPTRKRKQAGAEQRK